MNNLRRKRTAFSSLAPWLVLGLFGIVASLPRKTSPPAPAALTPARLSRLQPGHGRDANWVWEIPWRGWRDIVWRAVQGIGQDRLPIIAGGVTFYILLAVFPTLSAFISLYGLASDVAAVERQIAQLSNILPAPALNLLHDQMLRLVTNRDPTLGLTFGVSLALALWSANAGAGALFDGVNIAYGEAEKRAWWHRLLLTLAFTAAGLFVVTIVALLLVALPMAAARLYNLVPDHLWWGPFRWVMIFGIVAIALSALYHFGPSRQAARWRWCWPGGILGAAIWLTGSLGFSTYMSMANFEHAYGPLATVIGFMLWIWFSAMVVLIGAEAGAEIEHQTAVDTTAGPPAPRGVRGARMADTVGPAAPG